MLPKAQSFDIANSRALATWKFIQESKEQSEDDKSNSSVRKVGLHLADAGSSILNFFAKADNYRKDKSQSRRQRSEKSGTIKQAAIAAVQGACRVNLGVNMPSLATKVLLERVHQHPTEAPEILYQDLAHHSLDSPLTQSLRRDDEEEGVARTSPNEPLASVTIAEKMRKPSARFQVSSAFEQQTEPVLSSNENQRQQNASFRQRRSRSGRHHPSERDPGMDSLLMLLHTMKQKAKESSAREDAEGAIRLRSHVSVEPIGLEGVDVGDLSNQLLGHESEAQSTELGSNVPQQSGSGEGAFDREVVRHGRRTGQVQAGNIDMHVTVVDDETSRNEVSTAFLGTQQLEQHIRKSDSGWMTQNGAPVAKRGRSLTGVHGDLGAQPHSTPLTSQNLAALQKANFSDKTLPSAQVTDPSIGTLPHHPVPEIPSGGGSVATGTQAVDPIMGTLSQVRLHGNILQHGIPEDGSGSMAMGTHTPDLSMSTLPQHRPHEISSQNKVTEATSGSIQATEPSTNMPSQHRLHSRPAYSSSGTAGPQITEPSLRSLSQRKVPSRAASSTILQGSTVTDPSISMLSQPMMPRSDDNLEARHQHVNVSVSVDNASLGLTADGLYDLKSRRAMSLGEATYSKLQMPDWRASSPAEGNDVSAPSGPNDGVVQHGRRKSVPILPSSDVGESKAGRSGSEGKVAALKGRAGDESGGVQEHTVPPAPSHHSRAPSASVVPRPPLPSHRRRPAPVH